MSSSLNGSTLAFVTSNEFPDLTPGDRIASDAIRAEGGSILPVLWDDPHADWQKFDAIIIRSTWDYHLRPAEFALWLDSLQRRQLPVWNPVKTLRWNMDKHYLLDVGKKGVPIPKTMFLGLDEPFEPARVGSILGTGDVVVKPLISASAWNTWHCSLTNLSDRDAQRLLTLHAQSPLMVQEFMPEIGAGGEWSLIFFGGQFSHAVKKYPATGDFRVQEALGGRSELEPNPPQQLIRQAAGALAAIDTPLLYARVDGVVRNGTFILMELELLEPSLFFELNPSAAGMFTRHVAAVLRR